MTDIKSSWPVVESDVDETRLELENDGLEVSFHEEAEGDEELNARKLTIIQNRGRERRALAEPDQAEHWQFRGRTCLGNTVSSDVSKQANKQASKQASI